MSEIGNYIWTVSCQLLVPLDMKGCICHFVKWQMHPFISKKTSYSDDEEVRKTDEPEYSHVRPYAY